MRKGPASAGLLSSARDCSISRSVDTLVPDFGDTSASLGGERFIAQYLEREGCSVLDRHYRAFVGLPSTSHKPPSSAPPAMNVAKCPACGGRTPSQAR